MSYAANLAMLKGMAVRHREDAARARALGMEASAAGSIRAAEMLEREVRLMEGDYAEPREETPLSTPKVLL